MSRTPETFLDSPDYFPVKLLEEIRVSDSLHRQSFTPRHRHHSGKETALEQGHGPLVEEFDIWSDRDPD